MMFIAASLGIVPKWKQHKSSSADDKRNVAEPYSGILSIMENDEVWV
jgi:hypothetical protein